MPSAPPSSITTDRLLLRPWRSADLPAFREAFDESAASLRPWVPWARPDRLGPGEAAALVTKWATEFAAGVAFVYATFSRPGGVLQGGVGLYPRVGPGAIEIGYWIRDAAAGRGFATEASRALTAVGFGLEGIERIEIHCATDNAASRRVPEKLGYQPRIGGDATGADRAVYEMSRTQFMGAANGA